MANSLHIKFNVPGSHTFSRMFNNLENVPNDMSEVFHGMAQDFWMNNEMTFREEGPGWKPLAQSTIKQRVRAGFGAGPILERTGALKRSLTEMGAPGQILRISPRNMEIGTSVSYGIYHQTGNLRPARIVAWGHDTGKFASPGTRPPKRSPIDVRDALQRQWQNRISKWLQHKFDEAGS